MAELTQERALREWTGLQELIQAGAYQERGGDPDWPEDGIEKRAFELETWAATQGLCFSWSNEDQAWELVQMDPENLLAFLKANVEALRARLREVSDYLKTFAWISERERAHREKMLARAEAALANSYRVPVVREESEGDQ